MKFSDSVHDAKAVTPNYFGEYVSSHLAPSSGQHFSLGLQLVFHFRHFIPDLSPFSNRLFVCSIKD